MIGMVIKLLLVTMTMTMTTLTPFTHNVQRRRLRISDFFMHSTMEGSNESLQRKHYFPKLNFGFGRVKSYTKPLIYRTRRHAQTRVLDSSTGNHHKSAKSYYKLPTYVLPLRPTYVRMFAPKICFANIDHGVSTSILRTMAINDVEYPGQVRTYVGWQPGHGPTSGERLYRSGSCGT